jgi:hypothetical protein
MKPTFIVSVHSSAKVFAEIREHYNTVGPIVGAVCDRASFLEVTKAPRKTLGSYRLYGHDCGVLFRCDMLPQFVSLPFTIPDVYEGLAAAHGVAKWTQDTNPVTSSSRSRARTFESPERWYPSFG